MKHLAAIILLSVTLVIMFVFSVAIVPLSRSIADVQNVLEDDLVSAPIEEYIGEEIDGVVDIPPEMLNSGSQSGVSDNMSSTQEQSSAVTTSVTTVSSRPQSGTSSGKQSASSSKSSSTGKTVSHASPSGTASKAVSSVQSFAAHSSGSASLSTSSAVSSQPSASPSTLMINMGGTVVSKPVKEVLAGIVANEMGENMALEALKAQAVAAHTFILYYNSLGKAPEITMRTPVTGGNVLRAVDAVYNKLVYVGNKVVYTPYHSTSAGRTQAASEVWGGVLSHLVSVESKYDKNAPNFESTLTFTRQEAIDCIKKALNVTPTGDMSTWFTFYSQKEGGVTSGGYVGKIKVCGKETTGRKVRENIMLTGGKMLRSAKFTIAVKNDSFVFTTYGYGHGVGLSQYGAHFYAKNDGMTYDKILCHYYTGAVIGTAK